MVETDDGVHAETVERLLQKARDAMTAAYAPYSQFSVGAALEADDGHVYVGCNVENASYPVGMCAERVALGQAIACGARKFRRIVVLASGAKPASPCGMCRQALAEFGLHLEVISVTESGRTCRWLLADLLPDAFRLDEVDP